MTASSTWHSAKQVSTKPMRNNRLNECDIFMVCSFWFGLFSNWIAFTEGSSEGFRQQVKKTKICHLSWIQLPLFPSFASVNLFYFGSPTLWLIHRHPRHRLAQFNLGAHFAELRGLLFDLRDESFHSFLLLSDR